MRGVFRLWPSKNKMIILDNSLFINQGTVRACYQLPGDDNRIIKVPIGDKKDRDLANIRELNGYKILMREHTDLTNISHCYGIEQTNIGEGLVCDCIYDKDGSVSMNLLEVIISASPPDYSYLKRVLEEFCNYLLRKNVFVFDLNVKNIVMQHNSGTYKPFLVDLKGRYEMKEFIPFSKYIPFFRRKKLERRCRQLLDRTQQCWQRRAELADCGG